MLTTPSISTPISNKYSLPLLLGLIAAGLAGNYFKYQIFLNIDFLFGSIFAMLALQFFGRGRGILAAAIIAGYTYFLWNHPYAIIIMTAEVAVVGWLMTRRTMGMVLADTLYWLFIGMPLVYLFYHVVMHVPLSNTSIVVTKQAVNGIANALVARLVFSGYAHRSRSSLTSYRENIYNLLTFFVLCPVLILLATGSRADFKETDRAIRSTLIQESRQASKTLTTWVLNRKTAIVNLAEMAASRSPKQMQPYLEQAKKADINFLRVGLLDKNATITAYFPTRDELGRSSIGKNFADRLFIPVLKHTLKPMLSEVVMGKIGTPKPVVVMLAPIVIRGGYSGYVTGTLSLEQVRVRFDEITQKNEVHFTLIDKNGNVIMTNRTDQTVMAPFVRDKGTLKRLEDNISQWVPIAPPNTPVSERWKKSFYITETSIGDLAEWKLVIEQPVAPFQKALYDKYTGKLAQLFLILLVAQALAEFISRRIMITLDALRQISSDIPSKLASGTVINWPESGIRETSILIGNFQQMSNVIQQHVVELNVLNDSLEQRVEERTREITNIMQELNIILENAPTAISKIINREMVWVNRKFEDMFQYSKKEMENQTTRVLYTSDEAYEKLGQEAYTQLAQGAVFDTVQELQRKDGGKVQVRYIGKAIDPSDMTKGVIWIVEDISERRKAEERLLEANQFVGQIINSVQEGVIVYGLDMHYRVWNPFMEQISGMSADKVMGRRPSELFPFLHASGVNEGFIKVLSGEEFVNNDFPYSVPKTGKSGWASDQMGPLLNTKGEIIGVISTVRDITVRKQLEDDLRQALETANNTNSTMNRLLRTVAHEFRTPLGLLTLSTDILDRHWDHLTLEKRVEQNGLIRNAANQLANLVNSVISFNKYEAEMPGKPLLLLDVGEFCRTIAGEVETVWSTGHEFTVTIASDCGTALLDQILFRQILENLLTNAFRYTSSDGAVSFQVKREKNQLCLDICDTGIGIPEEDQKLIFDAFFRCRNVEGRRGLGLGLSIVHEALSAMGGIIEMTSKISEGTSMLVHIPIEDPNQN